MLGASEIRMRGASERLLAGASERLGASERRLGGASERLGASEHRLGGGSEDRLASALPGFAPAAPEPGGYPSPESIASKPEQKD
jgi:hypothetical protein